MTIHESVSVVEGDFPAHWLDRDTEVFAVRLVAANTLNEGLTLIQCENLERDIQSILHIPKVETTYKTWASMRHLCTNHGQPGCHPWGPAGDSWPEYHRRYSPDCTGETIRIKSSGGHHVTFGDPLLVGYPARSFELIRQQGPTIWWAPSKSMYMRYVFTFSEEDGWKAAYEYTNALGRDD